ncbi:hypothetical protein PM082_022751 [Marasmius tenuissimus]|nr:hypothetical protein PM082_022751 [Marasmius tenuissimus]
MARIEYLPVELLLMVVAEAKNNNSLKPLRLVNRLFCSLIEPLLFETIIFDSSLSTSYDLLKTLGTRNGPHRISTCVRTLVIRCFDRHFSPARYYVTVSGACQAHECQRLFDSRVERAVRALRDLKGIKVLAGCDSISPNSVWSALKKLADKISLKHITVSAKLDRTFLDYLSSSGIGLEDLAIHRAWSSPDERADRELADLFFHGVLPRHRDTLKTLVVTAAEEGPWCVRRGNIDEVAACRNLREIGVSVNSEGLGASDPEGGDVLTSTLDMAHRLPFLTNVSFSPADSKRWGGSSSWGVLAEQHGPRTVSMMVKRVMGLDLSQHPSSSPSIEIDGQVYLKPTGGERYLPSLSLDEARSRRGEKHRW